MPVGNEYRTRDREKGPKIGSEDKMGSKEREGSDTHDHWETESSHYRN